MRLRGASQRLQSTIIGNYCVKGFNIHGDQEALSWIGGVKSEWVEDVKIMVSVFNIGRKTPD